MDSKAVNVGIRNHVRPLLVGTGFNRSTARTFWRDHHDRVDLVNFQSFNSHNASVLGVTTHSFALNVGCYLRYIPNQHASAPGSARLEGTKAQPKEYDCQMRGRLDRTYPDRVCSDLKIWYVDPVGSNLEKAVQDSCHVLTRDGMPWFEQFTSPRSVYDILAVREEDMGRLWGFGRPASPLRTYLLGYAANAAGFYPEAARNLTDAANTNSFESIRERILADAHSAAAAGN